MLKLQRQDVLMFLDHASDMIDHEVVLSMKSYIQHSNVNCYEHSVYVAFCSFRLAYVLEKWVRLDKRSIVRGAMLHDFFLYDWHHPRGEKEKFFEKHGFTHPLKAYKNAIVYFKINPIEKDIILKHMWPLNLSPPATKESLLVTLVDKYCSLKEVVMPWTNKNLKEAVLRITTQK